MFKHILKFCLQQPSSVSFLLKIVLPILYFIPDENAYTGRYEDSLDAIFQIVNSPRLLVFCLLYLFSITFYNYCGLAVTKSLTGQSLHTSID